MRYLFMICLSCLLYSAKAQIDSSFAVGQLIKINNRPEPMEVSHIMIEDTRQYSVSGSGHYYLMEIDAFHHALGQRIPKTMLILFSNGTWVKGDTVTITNILGDKPMIEQYIEYRNGVDSIQPKNKTKNK